MGEIHLGFIMDRGEGNQVVRVCMRMFLGTYRSTVQLLEKVAINDTQLTHRLLQIHKTRSVVEKYFKRT